MNNEYHANPMIQITNLEFQYRKGGFCLHIPKLEIEVGEKVAIIGASGSGKTTLLQLLSGIRTPTSGEIKVDDIPLERLCERERRQYRISKIGFIFQNFELIEYLNVFDNILHPYRLNPALILNDNVRQRAREWLSQVGLENKLKRHINALSQGEKQRVAICRALLTQPKLLLADEATGNLDPANKQRVLDILFHYVDEHQATLLAVTHDHELLHRFDRVIDFLSFMNKTTKEIDSQTDTETIPQEEII